MNGPIRAYPARRRGYFARWLQPEPGPVGAYPVRSRRPKRFRKLGSLPSWAGGLAILLVVALALTSAVVADTVVRLRVQRDVAAALNQSLSCSPQVSVKGLSAIWQVRNQHFSDILVRCDRADVNRPEGDPVSLTDLRLDGHDIRGAQEISDAVLGTATISAVLPYSEASAIVGSQVSPADGGRIAITQNVEVAGVAVPVTYTAVVGVAEGKLVLTGAQAEAVGVTIPQVVVERITTRILNQAVLPTIGSMTVSSIVPIDDGLLVTLYGTDVSLRDLQ